MDINIHFCTPCYGGQISESCFQSYIKWTVFGMQNKLAFQIDTLSNESNINRGRNSCAAKFLMGKGSHLMFVDADIGWAPEDIVKLVTYDVDVACGVYPQKTIPPKYVVNIKENGERKGDLIEAHSTGTGFMLIKRQVFEKLIEAGATKYHDDIGLGPETEFQYDFFNCTVDKTGQYLTEDYSFCRSVQQAGLKVWIDKSIELRHTGFWHFNGDNTLLSKF